MSVRERHQQEFLAAARRSPGITNNTVKLLHRLIKSRERLWREGVSGRVLFPPIYHYCRLRRCGGGQPPLNPFQYLCGRSSLAPRPIAIADRTVWSENQAFGEPNGFLISGAIERGTRPMSQWQFRTPRAR